jgi:hypothetical protein
VGRDGARSEADLPSRSSATAATHWHDGQISEYAVKIYLMERCAFSSRIFDAQVRSGNPGYGGRMKIKQIIGVFIMLSGVVCFWLESADRSRADWKIDALGILLVLFGLWVGKFSFTKNKDGSAM